MSQGTKQQVSVDYMYTAIKGRTMVLSALALLSFLIKALLAFNTFGTNDILMFQTSLQKADEVPGIQMYEDKTVRLEYHGEML